MNEFARVRTAYINFNLNIVSVIHLQEIRNIVKKIDLSAKEAATALQTIHVCITESKFFFVHFYQCPPTHLPGKRIITIIHKMFTYFILHTVGNSCMLARKQFEDIRQHYKCLAEIVPAGQYYKYCDHWHFLTQRVVFLIALTVYLEVGTLVTRETVAEILGRKTFCRRFVNFVHYIS